MRIKILFLLLLTVPGTILFACPVCEKRQPRLLRGITHGTGPASNWDWVIVLGVTVFAIAVLLLSVRYLLRPGEQAPSHVKQIVLIN